MESRGEKPDVPVKCRLKKITKVKEEKDLWRTIQDKISTESHLNKITGETQITHEYKGNTLV